MPSPARSCSGHSTSSRGRARGQAADHQSIIPHAHGALHEEAKRGAGE
jgi:hypothetical protein